MKLLEALRAAAGDQLTTFELMPQRAVDLTVSTSPAWPTRCRRTAWYLLVELTSPNPQQQLTALLTDRLHLAAGEAW